MSEELYIYNSLTNKKELFKEIEPGKIGLYVCGPTVYSSSHMGHARSAIVFDSIVRFLKFLKYETKYVRNFTDIDDKIIARAKEENKNHGDISSFYKQEYIEDMNNLGCMEPDLQPCVSENMNEIIALISKIIDSGHAYVNGGDVYFDVKKFSEYGKLSNQSIEAITSNTRLEINPNKNDDLDFALWKKAKEDEPSWDSPWGTGRPGWHIECSAMSCKYLGETFDIHGGGRDLIFPHHENEVAQSECISKKSFANYWIHNGLININKEKMSKSIGNIINIREGLKSWDKNVIRVLFLTHHYRSPVDLSEEKLLEIKKLLLKISKKIDSNPKSGTKSNFKEMWTNAMLDDFNTAKAFGYYFKYINDGLLSNDDISSIEEFENTMGISDWRDKISQESENLNYSLSKDSESKINQIILDRNLARNAKDWDKADELRLKAEKLGVRLLDTKDGTSWERKD